MSATITGFADACAEAFGLYEEFGRGEAGVAVGPGGVVQDAWVLIEPQHTVDCVLGAAHCELAGTDVLVISVRGDDELTVLSEDDVATWYRLVAETKRRGARLLDWILVSSEALRSLRISTDVTGVWPSLDPGRPAA